MAFSLGIVFGILAMIVWGVADFLVAIAVRKENALRALLWTQIASVLLAGIVYVLFFTLPALSTETIMLIFASAALSMLSWAAYYKGVQIGKVSIVSPIADCWPVITIFLGIVFLKESLSAFQAIGAALAIIGAVLASFKFRDLLALKNPAKGVPYSLVGLFGWGLHFFIVAILVEQVGWFFSLFLVKIASVLILVAYFSVSKTSFAFPTNAWKPILAVGAFEAAGSLIYGFSITLAYSALIAPIIACVPLVIVILSRIFFKERIAWNQGVGIASIIIGLVLLAV